MIRKLERHEIKKAALMTRGMCLRSMNLSYPLFCSAREAEDEYFKCITDPNADIVGWFDGDALTGVLSYFTVLENEYAHAQTTGLYISSKDYSRAANELIDYLEAANKNRDLLIGLKAENIPTASILKKRGYLLVEACFDLRVSRSMLRPSQEVRSQNLMRIGEEQWSAYTTFHNSSFNDIYWNADRIYKCMDKWVIGAYMQRGRIEGEILINLSEKTAEIFALSAPDRDTALNLITVFLSKAFEQMPSMEGAMYSFNCDDPAYYGEAAFAAGFELYSRYRCWGKRVD